METKQKKQNRKKEKKEKIVKKEKGTASEEGERRKLKLYNLKWHVKVSFFTPFWQEIEIIHLKFEFYDNENLMIAST